MNLEAGAPDRRSALRFMERGLAVVQNKAFATGRTTVPPHPGPLPLGGGEGESLRPAEASFATFLSSSGIHQFWLPRFRFLEFAESRSVLIEASSLGGSKSMVRNS